MRTVWSLLAAGSGLQEISSKVRVAVKSEASFSEERSRVVVKHEVEEAAGHASGPASTCKRWNAGAGAYWANGDDWGNGGPAMCSSTLTNDAKLDKNLECIMQQQYMQEVGFVALDRDVTGAFPPAAVHKDHTDALTPPDGKAHGCWAEVGGGFSSNKWKKVGHKEKLEDVKSNCIGTGHDNLFITYGKTGGEQVFSWLWKPTSDAEGGGRIRYYYPKNFAYGLYRSGLGDNLIGKGMKAACWKQPGSCLDLNYCFSCTGSFCPNRDKCPGGEGTLEKEWSPAQPGMAWKPCALTAAETGDEWTNCPPESHVTLAGGVKVVLRSIRQEAAGDATPRYRLQLIDIPKSPGYDGRPCFLHSILACSVSDGQPMGRMFADPEHFGESAEMQVCGLPA